MIFLKTLVPETGNQGSKCFEAAFYNMVPYRGQAARTGKSMCCRSSQGLEFIILGEFPMLQQDPLFSSCSFMFILLKMCFIYSDMTLT